MSSLPDLSSAPAGDEATKIEPNDSHDQHSDKNKAPIKADDVPIKADDAPSKVDDAPIKVGEAPAKKKKSRKGKRGKNRATGFEEFFCDPPLTPDEYDEERNVIYPADRPFVDRIEECIQRFRARRRMATDRDNIFSKYLSIGGVDTTVRQFQSTRKLGPEDLENKTKSDIRQITADDVIRRGGENLDRRWYNPDDPDHWDVDFTGVAKGFCSELLVDMVGAHGSDYRMGVEVVFNFLKYVEHHDVCPEYADDLKNAQKVCETALEEMPAVCKVVALLPGAFNYAATLLFCKLDNPVSSEVGDVSCEVGKVSSEVGDGTWEMEDKGLDDVGDGTWEMEDKGFNDSAAKIIFGATLAILLDPKLSKAVTGSKLTVTHTSEQTFEVCDIAFADDEARVKYKATSQHLAKHMGIKLETCGSMVVRSTIVRNGWDNTSNETLPGTAEETFILEESILEDLKVGMAITMTVCTLNVGLKFIKEIKKVYPTFYLFLPQQLMLKFKEPTLNPRPAPNVHNPDADDEEDVLGQIPLGDIDLDD